MTYRLTTLLYLFALVAASLAAFGMLGIAYVMFVVAAWSWFAGNSASHAAVLLIAFASLFVICAALFLPALASGRNQALRNMCKNNCKQLALAALNYHDQTGSFPPPYTTDASGKRLHSWRVLLLPYLEEQKLYDRIQLNEPWDSEHNQQFHSQVPEVFQCPSCLRCQQQADLSVPQLSVGFANYFAVVAENTMWPQEGGVRMKDVSDGSSSTLLFVEAGNRDINWMEPVDLSLDEATQLLTASSSVRHCYLRNNYFTTLFYSASGTGAFVDGHVESMHRLEDESLARDLTVRNDGRSGDGAARREAYVLSPEPKIRINWRNVYAFTAFVAMALLPAFPAIRRRISPGGAVFFAVHRRE